MCMPVASLLASAEAPFNKLLERNSEQGLRLSLDLISALFFEHLKELFEHAFWPSDP